MASRKYRANWTIKGFGKKPLVEGDTVSMDESDAAELVRSGALSLASEAATGKNQEQEDA